MFRVVASVPSQKGQVRSLPRSMLGGNISVARAKEIMEGNKWQRDL